MSEKRPVPNWIKKELITIGGKADDGKAPFLRFIHPEDAYLTCYGQMVPRYWEKMSKKVVGYSYIANNNTRVFSHFDDVGMPHYKYAPEWRRVNTREECLGPFITHYDRVYTLRKHWVLEAWMPPEKYVKTWEQERYLWEDNIKKDILGPPPPSGDYTCIVTLNGNYGTPKDIGRKALEYVRKIWKIMLDDPMWKDSNWREEATEGMKARARDEAKAHQATVDKKDMQIIDDEVREVFEPAKNWIFGKEKSTSIGSGKEFVPPSMGLVDQFGVPFKDIPIPQPPRV